jgi:hypothetical protein
MQTPAKMKRKTNTDDWIIRARETWQTEGNKLVTKGVDTRLTAVLQWQIARRK